MGLINFIKNRKKRKQIEAIVEIQPKKVKAGIAFGGGGARGFGHIGVIKAFEENNIDFKYVSGTSVGSMIGALYAAGMKSDEILEYAKTMKEKDLRNSRVIFIASQSSNIEDVMKKIIGDKVFSDLEKPFTAVAVDMKTGQEVHLNNGSVARAVSASCSIPGIFTPVFWHDYVLQDGGLTNTVPSDVARKMGAEFVVAIDINSTRGSGTNSTKMLDLLSASLGIAMKASAQRGIDNADIVIRPDLKQFSSTKLSGVEEMFERGYSAAMDVMPEIKKLLQID